MTEIYDYLRLLWSRVGKPHCPICGRPIVGQSAEQIIDQVMELAEGTRFMVLAPVVRGRKGEYGKLLEELRADGFARVKIDDRVRMLEESIVLDKRYKHDISVVVDRLVMRHDVRKRLADSIETAVGAGRRAGRDRDRRLRPFGRAAEAGDGRGEARARDRRQGRARGGRADRARRWRREPGTMFTFSERFACPEHGPSLVELEPRIFSFNSPHGACERCTGLGSQMEIDPELVVPDPSLSIGEGALAPWANSASNYYEQVTEAIAERYGVDLDAPWEELPDEQRDAVPVRDERRAGAGHLPQPLRAPALLRDALRGDRQEPRAPLPRDRLGVDAGEDRGVHVAARLPGVRRRAAARRSRARCSSAGTRIEDFCALSARRALEWLEEVELSETDRHVARLILREISERLQFLENVGIGYLSMDRAAATLSGGEAQRIRLATQIGSSLVGVLYILDEPSIGLHQRDNSKLIGDARAAARPRQHGDRGRARRADDARRRPPRRPRPGRRASTAGGSSRRGRRREVQRVKESLTGQFLSGDAHDRAARRGGARRAATSRSSARASTTCATSTCTSRSAC